MRSNTRMKFGEAHYIVSQNVRMENGIFKSVKLPYHEQRMSKDAATEYYGQKCKDAFNILGVGKVEKIDNFALNFQSIFKKIRKSTEIMLRSEGRKLIKRGYYER